MTEGGASAPADSPPPLQFRGPLTVESLRAGRPGARQRDVYVGKGPLCSAALARELAQWNVRRVQIWRDITRAALRELVPAPTIRDLHLLRIRRGSALNALPPAPALHSFRCDLGVTAEDIQALTASAQLRQLGAQTAELSERAVAALAGMETLQDLDLERSDLDDGLVEVLATSRSITTLSVCATRITARGLDHIAAMPQLRELDIWALDIEERDLERLAALPNLEWISVGGAEGQTRLSATGVLRHLAALPSLKRVWLDGIALTAAERNAFEERYDKVRVN